MKCGNHTQYFKYTKYLGLYQYFTFTLDELLKNQNWQNFYFPKLISGQAPLKQIWCHTTPGVGGCSTHISLHCIACPRKYSMSY